MGKDFSTRFILHDNDKKQQFIFGLTIFFILVLSSTSVMADLLPVNRFPEIDDELIALKMLGDPGCQEKLKNAGFTNIQDFLNLVNDKGYFASIGRILFPIKVDDEEFEKIFKYPINETDKHFFTFTFLDTQSEQISRKFFIPNDEEVELRHGVDAIVIWNNNEVSVIGLIDSKYTSSIRSYDNIWNTPVTCYFSRHLFEDSN